MQDKFNTVENLILNFLQNDSNVAALVNHFHTKILDDIAKYPNHQLPAVAVHAIGYSQEESRITNTISAIVEIVNRGGDLESVDGKVKEIASLIIDKLNAESPRDGYGAGLSDNVEDVYIVSANIIPVRLPNGFIVSGICEVNVEIREN